MPVTDLLTPPQVAKRMRVNPDKVRLWIARGELAAVNLGGPGCRRPRYRVSAEALAQFLARRQVLPRVRQERRRPKEKAPGWVDYY